MKSPPLFSCPGCGGRNPRGTPACDWCGRTFLSRERHVDVRWLRAGASLLLAMLVGFVVLLAVLNAGRPTRSLGALATPTVAPTSVFAAPPPLPSPVLAETPVVPAKVDPSPTVPPPSPEPSPTPEPTQLARIANTDGRGANLRSEPSTTSQRITALREGTTVTVLNRQEVTAARVWRLVRAPNDVEGWIMADLLEFEG